MSNTDLSSILGSLSGDDIESLKKIASGLMAENSGKTKPDDSDGGEENSAGSADGETAEQSPLSGIDLSSVKLPDISKFASLAPILEQITKRDERTDFLMALKPFLSENRQPKADEAARLLKLINLIPLLRERGIL